MAKVTIDGMAEISKKITALGDAGDAIGKMAVYDGAAVITDELRKQINALPEDEFRYLRDGDQFGVITAQDKADLANSLGIAKIERTAKGIRTVIGFAGYGTHPPRKYPKGLPMAMLARSIESGSSVRAKRPFVRKTVNGKKKLAQAAMIATGERLIEKTLSE